MVKESKKMDQIRDESSSKMRNYQKIKIGSEKAKFPYLMINQVVELVGLLVQHQL